MDKFSKCAHQTLTKKQIKGKECISPKSDAFEGLQSIALCKSTLKDLGHFTQFCHTGVSEVYHALSYGGAEVKFCMFRDGATNFGHLEVNNVIIECPQERSSHFKFTNIDVFFFLGFPRGGRD